MNPEQSEKWTAELVEAQFEEAIYTLKRLPPVRVQGYFNAWPDIVRTTQEIQQAKKQPLRLGPPSAAAIDRMEACLEWICWLENITERDVVWLRAQKVVWKRICAQIGYGRTKAWEIHTMALCKIAALLNARKVSHHHKKYASEQKNTEQMRPIRA